MFEYGESFPCCLAAQADLANYPYLADVAKVECLMRQSCHAEDAEVLVPEALAAVQPDGLSDVSFKPPPPCGCWLPIL